MDNAKQLTLKDVSRKFHNLDYVQDSKKGMIAAHTGNIGKLIIRHNFTMKSHCDFELFLTDQMEREFKKLLHQWVGRASILEDKYATETKELMGKYCGQ